MSKSHMICEADVRRLLRLVGEVAELPRETNVRVTHLLEGLRTLVGARLAVFTKYDAVGVAGKKAATIWGTQVGLEPGVVQLVARYFATLDPPDPTQRSMFAGMARPVWTVTRDQLVDDRTWYGCDHYHAIRVPSDVDHHLYSTFRVGEGGRVNAIGLHRNGGERRFTRRECRIVHLLHEHLDWLYRQDEANPRDPRVDALPPRVRRVFEMLLTGAAEKELARHLSLSRNTIHSYVKACYKELGVGSRAELLAKFVRR